MSLTMEITNEEIQELNQDFDEKSPEELLRWAFETFGDEIVMASSFSIEDVALIDMALKLSPKLRIVTLDTGRLSEEVYAAIDAIQHKYGIPIEVYFPEAAKVEALVHKKGLYSFRESVDNRKECCWIRKVEPLNRALKDAKAWITGQRRSQAATRGSLPKIQIDTAHDNIVKINPLTDWLEERTWAYVKKHQVPYNRLYDAGYRSIGCAPCTRPVKPGEDERAGRWWWENPEHKECGIHRK